VVFIFYRIKTRSKKWYKRILYHFTDLSLVNAFVLFKEAKDKPSMPLFQFKLSVALSLMYCEDLSEPLSRAAIQLATASLRKAANGDPISVADPEEAVRLDGYGHFPEVIAQQQRRCKVAGCLQRSVVWCSKCQVYLCLKRDRNCFLKYHTAP